MQLPPLHGHAQRLARAEQFSLPDHLVQTGRSQALGQRDLGGPRAEEVVRQTAQPSTTVMPGVGTNWKRSAGKGTLTSSAPKVKVDF